MRDKEKVCGTCCWHKHENICDGWICVCDKSDYCADYTDYDYSCEHWALRK